MKIYEFNTPAQLLAGVKQTDYKSAANDFLSNEKREAWAGVTGITQFNEYLTKGYAPAVVELSEEITRSTGQGCEFTPSVSGIFYDVAAFNEGRPECMAQFVPAEENKFKTIFIEASTPSTFNGADLMKAARAVYTAVSQLELTGTRCKIVLAVSVRMRSGDHQCKLLVKNHEDPFISGYHGLLLGNHGTVRGAMYAYLSTLTKVTSIGSAMEATDPQADVNVSLKNDSPERIIKKILG